MTTSNNILDTGYTLLETVLRTSYTSSLLHLETQTFPLIVPHAVEITLMETTPHFLYTAIDTRIQLRLNALSFGLTARHGLKHYVLLPQVFFSTVPGSPTFKLS